VRIGLWPILLLLLAAAASGAGTSPIADIKTIDANGNAVSRGETFTVTGVVTVAGGTFSTADLDVYIQDASGGINVVKKGAGYFKLDLGDSVVVTGTLDQGGSSVTRGNTNLTVLSLDDIELVGRGTVPVPLTVTGALLGANAVPPLEAYEGMLVRVPGVTFAPADWPAAGSDKLITAQDATGTVKFRVDKDTDIDGSEAPTQPAIVTGVVVQDDGTTPILSNYIIWPRSRSADILRMGNGSGTADVSPSVVETDVASFGLSVTLSGNLTDTLTAFSIDLPIADGWEWPGGEVSLSGPGLEGATYEAGAAGVVIRGASIFDELTSFGVVTFLAVSSPSLLVTSEITVETSVDGSGFIEIASLPKVRSVRPKPAVVINEVYPGDAEGNAFIELHNLGPATASLEGLALCEVRAVAYCAPEVRHVFGAGDTIPGGGYLVVAASGAAFSARFGFPPDVVEAEISPLGRDFGDGAISSGIEAYEAVSLWRDASLTDLVACLEYRDGIACPEDLCEEFGPPDDGFPYIPPAGYALLYGDYPACCPYEALTAVPSPGAANGVAYHKRPGVRSATALSQDIAEIVFSEPMDAAGLADKSNYSFDQINAQAVYPSLSAEKVLVLFAGTAVRDTVEVEFANLTSWAGQPIADEAVKVITPPTAIPGVCDVQAFDSKGYSPLEGKSVSLLGFITVPPRIFQSSYQSIYVQGLDGCGVNAFSYDVSNPVPRLGDLVKIDGAVEEYVSSRAGSTTEIYMASGASVSIKATGYPPPEPLVLKTGEVGKEENEGKLVATEGMVVSASDISFYLDDGSGGIQVYQNYTTLDFTRFARGMYVKIKGVILQYDYTLPFLDGYELVPRFESDIEIVEDVILEDASLIVKARVFCPSCGEDGFAIKFGVPSVSYTRVRIFDGAGRPVATLYSGDSIGEREVIWSGRDELGRPLPPGLYVCHLETSDLRYGANGRATKTAPIVLGTELR
jgi:hypothetical protein